MFNIHDYELPSNEPFPRTPGDGMENASAAAFVQASPNRPLQAGNDAADRRSPEMEALGQKEDSHHAPGGQREAQKGDQKGKRVRYASSMEVVDVPDSKEPLNSNGIAYIRCALTLDPPFSSSVLLVRCIRGISQYMRRKSWACQ
jgi:hypothetical protein